MSSIRSILEKVAKINGVAYNMVTDDKGASMESLQKAKKNLIDQALKEIEELIDKAKPNKVSQGDTPYFKSSTEYGYIKGYNAAIEQYQSNLKEIL